MSDEERIRARAAARKKAIEANQLNRMASIMNTSPENTHMPEEYYRSLNKKEPDFTNLQVNQDFLNNVIVQRTRKIYIVQDIIALLSLIIGNLNCISGYIPILSQSQGASNIIFYLHNKYSWLFFVSEFMFAIFGLSQCSINKLMHIKYWLKHFSIRICMLMASHFIYTNLCL